MRVDREIKEKYFDESDTSFEARKLWYAFKDAIFYENRFFVKHQLLDILSQYMKENTLNVKPGQIYYRARIIDDSCINDHMIYKCYSAPDGEKLDVKYVGKANPFKGLTKEASFVPPKDIKVSEGRANPKYVKYLYVAESPTTAIFEVRPFIYDAVNIAKIQVNEPLRVANIAVDLDLSNDKNATVEMYVMGMIQGAFSKPTNNTDDYIPTQVIAEYIKSLGYDGIRFNSSIHSGGVNLTIFNYEKCEAISSQDFRIENIKLTARAAFGSANYDGDMHYIVDNEPKFLDFSKFPDIQDDDIIKINH
ncbi:MAG: RES family NAD+ phosphorylase [Bacteroidales bacterium]|nr:RES family NAD+ phosphorylase [Bacteroidales bacterium]